MAPFRVVQILERARELEQAGRDIVHLEVGEPDFPSAPTIVEAGVAALRAGRTGYTQALGLPALRAAIAATYGDLDPRRVAVTTGASAALNLLAAVLVNPSDEVLTTDPGYPCNGVFVAAAGGVARRLPVDEDTRFQMTPELAASAWTANTAGLLLASPSNPTGSMLDRTELRAIGEFAAGRGFVIVDEIYQGLVYRDRADAPGTALVADDGFFLVNSFSKYYGMTGWRLGWLVAPAWAMDAVERAAQNLYIAPPSAAQYAALAALEPAAMAVHEQRRGIFARRCDRLLAGLSVLGLPVARRPEGAFYVYVDISETGLDAETFCARLLEEFGVAATPGTDFGSHRANHHVRFAFTVDEARIALGLDRLHSALRRFRA